MFFSVSKKSIVKCILLPALLFVYGHLFSQNNIAGIWEGKFLSDEVGLGQPKLVVEIYDFKDSLFKGITHLYYQGNKYEHYKMTGWFDKRDSLLVFKEVTTIAVDLGIYGNCLGAYKMSLRKDGNKLLQVGYWVSTIKYCSPTTYVWLKKDLPELAVKEKTQSTKTKPIVKPANPSETGPLKKIPAEPVATTPVVNTPVNNPPVKKINPVILPEKVTTRETDVQSLIEISAAEKDSIRVDVYDNGEIDGDSVSVYQEGMLLINKKLITDKALTFYVSLNKKINPISHLRLVAESLGNIPPCTALMVVTTKKKRYEVRLSSNFSKNASVELFLKE